MYDCIENEEEEQKLSSLLEQKSSKNNNDQCENIGIASPSDVSPNTLKADEADI